MTPLSSDTLVATTAATEVERPDIVATLVAHLGDPVVLGAHHRARPQYIVVFSIAREDEFGSPREADLLVALAERLQRDLVGTLDDLELAWVDTTEHRVVALLSASTARGLRNRVSMLSVSMAAEPWTLTDGSRHRVDLGVGYARIQRTSRERTMHLVLAGATDDARSSLARRDLVCVRPSRRRRLAMEWSALVRLPIQIALTLVISLVVPFLALRAAYALGHDLSGYAYLITVGCLVVTSALVWAESLHALSPPRLPDAPDRPAPPATAIVAAYLPNETETILETVAHLLAQDYAGPLQVILAYNTPTPLPVEADLAALAARHPRLELLKVAGSSSKAQNVNAAIQLARGEFVGIFDADHHPMTGAFSRAWRWIGDGADVVQGHCVVRNGAQSRVARAVAVEFEQIYAVSHPGRASLHGFGVFGGSNGFWRAPLLNRMRMRVDRLTEDIDVSIRAVLDGATIVNDPGLLSRELAPVTIPALWRQRMRWAQGWFQVSARRFPAIWSNPVLTTRQRFGMTALFGWRELFPWVSSFVLSILAFQWWRDGGLHWNSTLLLVATLYTMSSGPVQTLFAWRLAAPEIRAHRGWFVWYVVCVGPFYTEWKNLIARVAQVKELMGERRWHVTPRHVTAVTAADPA